MAAMKDKVHHLGNLLCAIREGHRISQKELSRKGGVDQAAVSRFENDGMVSPEALDKYIVANQAVP